MTSDQILKAIETYRHAFESKDIGKINFPHDELAPQPVSQLEHAHGMLDKMAEFVNSGHLEKAFRWLGFVQGILWCNGYNTLDDLKSHNRSARD